MKNLYAILSFALLFFSCSESDDFSPNNSNAAKQPIKIIKALDPTKLAKVVFYPGTTSEKDYYFLPNGLIKKITYPNGNLFQSFTYDNNDNLVKTERFSTSTWISPYTYTFTYDNSNHVNSVNGVSVTFDVASNKYIYHYQPIASNDPECPTCYDYPDRTEITVNNDMLITGERTYYLSSDGDYSYGGMIAGYNNNNNMTYVQGWTDPSGPSYNYDNRVNPLRAAFLPVCRAMSAIRGLTFSERFMTGEHCSSNNVIFNGYGSSDPESEEYIIEYNQNNLPYTTIKKSYYFQALEYIQNFAVYYYQGDVIPNN